MDDVLIVGGGPAGASTAFQLARRGIAVRVLDRARFPRSKPCAECLSPQASRLLSDMDVLSELDSAGARLRGMLVRSPDGTVARGDYDAAHGFRPFATRGLAIRRERLDSVLIERARQAGARVDERMRVTDVSRDGRGRVEGVAAIDESGASHELSARIVVGADGLRSVVARRLGLARASRWPRRLSLVAHYQDVADVGEYGEMHIERDGFVGIADVGDGTTTVAAVFPVARATEISIDRTAFLDRWLASRPHLRSRFAGAVHASPVVATGPFASRARRASHPGAVLVGDAADFYDPFTGEGIYSALRGGELAADVIAQALADSRQERDVFDAYDGTRKREFGAKWWVETLIACGVALPPVANRAARALRSDPRLADLLVGVTGDFVPARRVLRPDYLAALLLLPLSSRQAPTASASSEASHPSRHANRPQ
ncbi:MAG TPA: geranylgeranyl reductase family protein [Gemmatimonadaceae bacterium]|nr:geranylgeranyl reductase family protein [Gemmatimonadaceae bacterium]